MKVRDLGVTLISVAVIDPSDSVDHQPDGAAGDGDGEADAVSEDLSGGSPQQ
jgi:hypothetical protein